MNNTGSDHKTPRLKPIPANTVVHTPTEAEAKELLAILHENGWIFGETVIYAIENAEGIEIQSEKNWTWWEGIENARKKNRTILTLAEFKERYYDFDATFTDECKSPVKVDEKPQPKFKVGDRVKVARDSKYKPNEGIVDAIGDTPAERIKVAFSGWGPEWFNQDLLTLEPTTDPEATVDEIISDNAELLKRVEEDKSQPKFKVGDKVVIQKSYYKEELHGRIGVVTRRATPFSSFVEIDKTIYQVSDRELEPYTEPETKPTKDKGARELNLCELLEGHIGEMFYSPIYGNIQLCEIGDDTFPLITEGANFMPDGRVENYQHGQCMLYPSRDLYRQYPLDPYIAWMKWQQEQKKHSITVGISLYYGEEYLKKMNFGNTEFPTTTDCDKCIEEIKAIIEKYSK